MINDPPGSGDPWLQAYREASTQDLRRPDPSVGDAVRAHARMLAQPQADPSLVSPEPDRRAGQAANAGSWRWSMLGGLAVIGLVGLLVVQFDQGSTPQERELARGGVTATPPTPAPRAQAKPGSPAKQEAPRAGTVTDSSRSTEPAQPAQAAALAQDQSQAQSQAQGAAMAQALSAARNARSAPAVPPVPAEPGTQALREGTDKAAQRMAKAQTAERAEAAHTAPADGARSPTAQSRAGPGAGAAGDALHRLAVQGRWGPFAELLAQGAEIDGRDAAGRTPLMQAAASGQRQMVQHLLQVGADAALQDRAGKTARQLAMEGGHANVAQLLPPDTPSSHPGR